MLELTRAQVCQLVAQGHLLVLHRRLIYRLNGWAAKHPGGALAILHFVGRDAASELEAYHNDATLERMRGFLVAHAAQGEGWSDSQGWQPLLPPVQAHKDWELLPDSIWSDPAAVESWSEAVARLSSSRELKQRSSILPPILPSDLEPPPSTLSLQDQHEIALDYRKLHDTVKSKGLYTPQRAAYRWDAARYIFCFASAMLLYAYATKTCALNSHNPLSGSKSRLVQGISAPLPSFSASSSTS